MKKVLGFLVAILVGLFLTYSGHKEWQDSKKLVAEGKSTIAEVTHHFTYKSGRRSSRKYKLVVAFETENKKRYKDTVQVSSSVYYAAASSGKVTVHYLPSDPSNLQAGPKAETTVSTFVIGLLILAGSLGVPLFYVAVALVHRGKTKTVTPATAGVGERPPIITQDGSQTIASLPAKDDSQQNYQKAA